MSEIARPTSFRTAHTARPVIGTTVGGVLRQAAWRGAHASPSFEGTLHPTRRRRWTFADLLAGQAVAGLGVGI